MYSKLNPILFSALSLLFLSACGNSKESNKPISNKVGASGVLVDNFDNYRDAANVTIKALDMYENTLFLTISYSGGCESHEFKLLGLKAVSKSIPPKREVMLYHNNNGDSCRELIEKKLKIDISNFAVENSDAVILEIIGWKNPVKYTP